MSKNKMMTKEEFEEDVAPFLRTAIAVLLGMRNPHNVETKENYREADEYLARLRKDLKL